MYAIGLDENNRVTHVNLQEFMNDDDVLVDDLPNASTDKERDLSNWLYIDGCFQYDPLPSFEESSEYLQSKLVNDAVNGLPSSLCEIDEAICTLYELMLGE